MLGEILVDSADQFEYVSSNFENLFQEGKDDNGVEKVLNFESRKKKLYLLLAVWLWANRSTFLSLTFF